MDLSGSRETEPFSNNNISINRNFALPCYCFHFYRKIREMDLKDSCKILLDKGNKQKIKCYKFVHKGLKRDLAVHPDIDHKSKTNITDIITGLRLCGLQKEFSKVTEADIKDTLNIFFKRYTIEETIAELERIENIQKEEK